METIKLFNLNMASALAKYDYAELTKALADYDAANDEYTMADFRDDAAVKAAIKKIDTAVAKAFAAINSLLEESNTDLIEIYPEVWMTSENRRHELGEKLCLAYGIEPHYVGGNGMFIHVSHGSRRSHAGYTLGGS